MEIHSRFIMFGAGESEKDIQPYLDAARGTSLLGLELRQASDFERAQRRDSLTLRDLRQELDQILKIADEHSRTPDADAALGYEELSAMYGYQDVKRDQRDGCPVLLNPEGTDKLEDLRYRWIAVFPVTGSNEGHYIHVDLIWQQDYREGRVCLFLTKTFMGHAAAVQMAGLIARVLGV